MAQQTFSHLANVAERAVGLVNQDKFHALRGYLTSQGVAFTRMNVRNLCLGYELYKPESVRLQSLFRITRFLDRDPLRHFHKDAARTPGIDAGLGECLADLHGKDRTLIDAATLDLGLYGDPMAVNALLDHLIAQGNGLGSVYLDVLPPADAKEWALAHLDDPDPAICRNAIRAAGDLKDPQAVSALMQILKNGRDRTLRKCAIGALGSIGDPRSVPLLVEMLRIPEFRSTARWALEQIDDPQAKSVIRTMERLDRDRTLHRDLYDAPNPKKPTMK
ncbi:MAG TPA: HEAT repeat domain-containing protein [bacterium]|nr:HEAT repeat domain-containing protein [bacterium]